MTASVQVRFTWNKNCVPDRTNKHDGRPRLAQNNFISITAMLAPLRRIWMACHPRATIPAVKFFYTYLLTSFPFYIYLNNTLLFSYKIINFINSFQCFLQQQVKSNKSFTPNSVLRPQHITWDLLQHGELIHLEDDPLNEPSRRTTIWQREGEVLAKAGLNSGTITSTLRLSLQFWGDH